MSTLRNGDGVSAPFRPAVLAGYRDRMSRPMIIASALSLVVGVIT
jgi:hypothetical protein